MQEVINALLQIITFNSVIMEAYNQSIDQFLLYWQNFKNDFITFLPKLAFAFIVLIAGYLIARLVRVVVRKTLHYLNKVINEKIRGKYLKVDLKGAARFIANTFFWIILISTFTLITEIINLTIVTTWLNSIVQYLPNVLAAILIVVAGIILGKLLADIILTTTDKTGLTYGYVLSKIIRYAVILISAVVAINQVGIDIGFIINLVNIVLAAILFGAGLAFGLGAKTSVNNILASYYVMKNYHEGDVIRIGDIEGKIVKISAANIIVDTEQGKAIIPAKKFNEMQSILIKRN